MTKQCWLVKSEPEAYAWTDLLREKQTAWTGVRNYQARIHLNSMKKGDQVFFYESVTTKAVVGIAEVTKTAFPDKTSDAPGWVAVEIKAVKPLPQAVTLARIKTESDLTGIALLRQSRLSVMPLNKDQFEKIVALGSP
jgi:predicted RNA-binding protein with PUA-like domain